MFDGSSIAGWKAINESDMVLMPDPTTAHMDPFFAQSTMAIFCDILDPITGEAYSRDPRTTAKKAEAYRPGIRRFGDTVYFGPEAGILHLRRRQVQGRSLQHRLQARFSELPTK
jgi:glutamine synthetase